MRAPDLRRRLVLETPLRVPDGLGGYAETWAVAGTLWAEVLPRGAGRDVVGASRLNVRITVRGAPQGAGCRPKAGQRFRDGDRVFHIEAVTEADPACQWLVCFATEEVGA